MANMGAMLRVLQPLTAGSPDPEKRRQLVADFCRLIGNQIGNENAGADLPPRLRETLTSLLSGASEKQIAGTMSLSPHTVHVYVKQIYKHYKVSSRGELLARWVKR
jgi:DNA-binding NarL/FixJ family response regulator